MDRLTGGCLCDASWLPAFPLARHYVREREGTERTEE